MIDDLISTALIAAMFAVFANTRHLANALRTVIVVVLCGAGWTVLVARGIAPISVADTQQAGALCLLMTLAIAASTIDGRRLPMIAVTVLSAGGMLVLLRDQWAPVAAVTLLTSAVAAVSISVFRLSVETNSDGEITTEGGELSPNSDERISNSSAKSLHGNRSPDETSSIARRLIAVVAASVVAVVTFDVFADMASLREFDADQICQTASLSAMGSMLIAIALFLEVAWSEANRTGPLIVFAGIAFAAVGREEAVIPAASLAAAIMLGPLISKTDQLRDSANRIAPNDEGSLT